MQNICSLTYLPSLYIHQRSCCLSPLSIFWCGWYVFLLIFLQVLYLIVRWLVWKYFLPVCEVFWAFLQETFLYTVFRCWYFFFFQGCEIPSITPGAQEYSQPGWAVQCLVQWCIWGEGLAPGLCLELIYGSIPYLGPNLGSWAWKTWTLDHYVLLYFPFLLFFGFRSYILLVTLN